MSKEEIEEMKEAAEFIYKKCAERDEIQKKRQNRYHYHYLVSYYVTTKKENETYFGDTIIDWAAKMNSNHIKRLKEYMLEGFVNKGMSIREITIISISPLECGCD